MKKNIRTILHYCRRVVLIISKGVTAVIPKDNNLILFTAWFAQKYSDSSMYQYEYMLENSKYKVKWYTKNRVIYNELKKSNKPVVYAYSFQGIYAHLRAKMLVSSVQFSDYNAFLTGNCILFDLDHGYPIKEGHFQQKEAGQRGKTYEYIVRWNVQYYMSASSLFCMEKVKDCFEIDPSKIVFCNKPRIDTLFDPNLRKGKNQIVEDKRRGKKVVVWMPTHRSCGNEEINVEEILDLPMINEICCKNNFVFFIKKHFYHKNEVSNLDGFQNIFDITNEDIDTQTLLYQADILVTDYSACYIDYLVLDRPIILYAYDLENYLKTERSLYLKFEDNNVGSKVKTKGEFSDTLEKMTLDWKDSEHADGRNQIRLRYFDKMVEIGSSRAKVQSIIDMLMNDRYTFDWSDLKRK